MTTREFLGCRWEVRFGWSDGYGGRERYVFAERGRAVRMAQQLRLDRFCSDVRLVSVRVYGRAKGPKR
jgi:hypothetical protein